MDFSVEEFSYRLSVLLDENNMTQKQLADKVGTTNVTICRYLNGERTPRLDVVTRIAYVFSVSTDYLFGLTDDKTAKIPNNPDQNIQNLITKLFSLSNDSNLSKKQIDAIKKLLMANKDFILSA